MPVGLREEHHVKMDFRGPRIRIWLDGSKAPLIDVVDIKPLTHAGFLGLRAWGTPFIVRDLTIESSGKQARVDRAALSAEEARRQALESLCLVILNLNEFAYVD